MNQSGLLIIMGDFNTQWSSNMNDLCKALALKAYQPNLKEITFSKTRKRLDWILISEEIEFIQYKTHQNNLSDHYAVSATLLLPALDEQE